MPTIREIAKLANVSASTVSRALRDYPHVSEDTRRAVLQVARELGYPIKPSHQIPRDGQVVFLTRQPLSQGQRRFEVELGGVEWRIWSGGISECQELGLATRVQDLPDTSIVTKLLESQDPISGFVLLGGIWPEDLLRQLSSSNLPVVLAGAPCRLPGVNAVAPDYFHGMEQAVNHLASQGRTRIGLLNGPEATGSSAAKFMGLRLALSIHDLSFESNRVLSGLFTVQSGYVLARELLSRAPETDGLICANPQMAFGCLRAIRESGRKVPEDLALIAFHDDEILMFSDPSITSIDVNEYTIGSLAVQRLWALARRPGQQACLTLVPVSLHIRRSTAGNVG